MMRKIIACSAFLLSASLASAEDFYKGKTLTMIVGFTAGGGFDTNARLLSRHITKHIQGKPDIVISNIVGAASFTGLQYLETRAPRDGTALATFNFGLIGDSKVFPERVKADFRNYAWIGSITPDVSVCYMWAHSGTTTLDEVRKKAVVHMGNDGIGTSAYLIQNILKNIFNVNLKMVHGYPGTAEVRLAIQRGELDGDCGAWSSIPEAWIKEKNITPLWRTASILLPDIPSETPYVVDIAPNEKAKRVIRLLTASGQLGRPFIASAFSPKERIEILRAAFDATMKDPDFLADAAKLRQPVNPTNANQAMEILNAIYDAPPELVAEARAAAGE